MLSEVIKKIRKSVILITTGIKVGTAFIINENGLAVTCRHVLETPSGGVVDSGTAVMPNCQTCRLSKLSFKVKRTERCFDLGLIELDSGHFEKLNFDENFGERNAGEEIAIFGFPFAPSLYHPSLTKGIIAALFTDPRNNVDMIQTDAWIYEASSGSPCFLTDDGTVIGYATSSFDPFAEHLKSKGIRGSIKNFGRPYQERTNICFVVPSKYVLEILESL